ncbi:MULTISPECIES: ArsR/SmtB family transcription factor [Oceanobacillus]|uniref:Transcriptional repressor SdpR n=2 Tax=Oceanobacillus TaxID=182709 RepID=A0A0A1MS70_9BACI|nr:metalloregulator ArsR/SmtB family transcription factor [Oceanobacillus oncorhynchi]MDM8099851.1 metalloregulator ArsR/SmtB family transcription factor [Oceanobacillus oncorhynchi]UUI40391.1 metalloregulator ArsR/SmtB family transcription factor [Oceanobacillus oncorhynchi]CEI81811.1 Transcriptional repressor SdpR [Oceanobacillus oncorhynchi]
MTAVKKHDVFQAIADPTRREILYLLSDQRLAISEITSHFSITRTAVVKHLTILSEAKLVSGEKVGREKIYYLHAEPLTEIKDWLSYFERFWDNKLSMLKYLVENEEEDKA